METNNGDCRISKCRGGYPPMADEWLARGKDGKKDRALELYQCKTWTSSTHIQHSRASLRVAGLRPRRAIEQGTQGAQGREYTRVLASVSLPSLVADVQYGSLTDNFLVTLYVDKSLMGFKEAN